MKKLLLLCICFASTSITNAQTADKISNIGLQGEESPYRDVLGNSLTGSFIVEVTKSYGTADDFVTLTGKVIDPKTKSGVETDVDIFYNSDFIKEYSGRTHYGEFTAPLKNFGWYIVSLSAPGYLETTDTLWVINEKRMTIYKVFYPAPLEVGLKLTLNHIYFNFGQTTLSKLSFPELNKEVKFFKENPGVVFEIAGHTDSDGPEDYNLILSQGRAKAVVDYLVSQGADRAQLIAQGYGETRPIDTHATESGKAKNRRVEFTVLSMGLGRVDKQN